MTTTALLAAGLTAGAAQAENRIDRQLPNAPELAAYGDYAVGVRTLEMVNPGQIDILAIDPAADKPEEMPRYDRPLTVEMYYPAAEGAEGETSFKAYLRDGTTEVTLEGQAMRDVDPAEGETFPLVLISHGYPGNRYLMSHLAENLASKGYVVASIDHTDSTYRTQAAFGSTLVNRSLDQLFVLEQMAQKAAEGGDFAGLYDAENTGLIGYSMGGYGAIITAGGGVTEASVGYTWGGPHGTLGIHQAGSETHDALPDPRIKTAVAFGPWGMNRGFWDAEGLAGVQNPILFIAGSQDDTSLYENGIRAIWENTSNVDRALLTYMNAGHNAGAPMPAPEEAYYFSEDKGFNISEHYTDAVWDTARMNNIAQHFVTAWMDSHLKGESKKAAYLELVENSNDGVWSVDEDGTEKEDHSYWKGFPEGTAKGLMYEVKSAAE
ncbi:MULTISPECIES: dienelactone hydrolase [Sulfitobacter]|uniref:alpha/beta hydrolase family protein n=1 Tax=Sulfitobacter TaxID=60136 RepID=UPI0023074DA9|nr:MULTISPECIES: dienelactone hydrolase [Sulfitobacter]MDF3382736.1 dienelactone hydrolase [Sulfitobacter sp. Ks11]MDF3386155.1 dienelactone hydrolase [Sulfitobacter sp. M85]MDF3389574.1 dienelactone hydrolase [Sulfitobacter sp. Ks16]MDF3400211.1 dienelactone hydrolase [Sulfitobacter sp. KE39]MDF3403632.1 dienelactone hydrolase [Sulfitobacter sp. Ks35]